MTSLRTSEGLYLGRLDEEIKNRLIEMSGKYTRQNLMKLKDDFLILTREGKLLADGIAADLFFT